MAKKYLLIWFIIFLSFLFIISFINFFINPYGLFKFDLFNKPKFKQEPVTRIVKASKIYDLKPISIILGNSRAEGGLDPNHNYFIKPSYNAAVSGGSIYEAKKYFEWALEQGRLKKVLLSLDYIMFNTKEKQTQDFDKYFNKNLKIKYLYSIDTLIDSYDTLVGAEGPNTLYYENGQRLHNYRQAYIDLYGGHMNSFLGNENGYYSSIKTENKYIDTMKNSFTDFEEIINKAYENNIELDIIFSPSHIRQWEALNNQLGIDKWFLWKKDLVKSVDKIAKQYNKKTFRIMDFSVYHPLTAETIPIDKNIYMKYYWESSHYKNELGLIVLDRLIDKSPFKDFGVELNILNIDNHLENLKKDRLKFLDSLNKQDMNIKE